MELVGNETNCVNTCIFVSLFWIQDIYKRYILNLLGHQRVRMFNNRTTTNIAMFSGNILDDSHKVSINSNLTIGPPIVFIPRLCSFFAPNPIVHIHKIINFCFP